MRDRLREATGEVHERLHHHPGFASVLAGRASLVEYRALIARLFGFYRGIEPAAHAAAWRSRLLAADLGALGLSSDAIAALPSCSQTPRLDTRGRRLGALYVIEGAALGGRQLARSLDALLGPTAQDGRRFLVGRGPKTGAAWRSFLSRLEAVAEDEQACGEAVEAAQETFGAFEAWVRDWDKAPAPT